MSELETRPDVTPRPVETAAKPRRKSLVREYGEAIVVAVLLALVIRAFVVQAFTIPSGSMMDTLLVGDYILVNKFLYGPEIPFTDAHLPGLRSPSRGDIIVFKYPNDETRDFIKRIIAVGGETVQIKDNRAYVDGKALDEPYVRPGSVSTTPAGHCGYLYGCEPLVVPPSGLEIRPRGSRKHVVVAARRFADDFQELKVPKGSGPMVLRPGSSQEIRPWLVQVDGATVCALR